MISRQQANRAILNVISQYVEDYPDMRFHQILHSLNLEENAHTPGGEQYCKDFFYLESDKALERISQMLDKPINLGTISSDFMEADKDENGKVIPLAKRKSISFRQIVAYDEMVEENDDKIFYLKVEEGVETYEDWIKHYDIIENEIMIMKSPDWGMEGYNNELEYHFSCGPSIGDECVSDSIFIDWYIEQVAERAGYKDKVETQLSENYHGLNIDNTYDAEMIYQALIDGFKQDGFKVIEVEI
jgi:hypothetical protein